MTVVELRAALAVYPDERDVVVIAKHLETTFDILAVVSAVLEDGTAVVVLYPRVLPAEGS